VVPERASERIGTKFAERRVASRELGVLAAVAVGKNGAIGSLSMPARSSRGKLSAFFRIMHALAAAISPAAD